MHHFLRRYPAFVAALALAAGALPAHAFMQQSGDSAGDMPAAAYREPQRQVQLSPIVVNGQHMPLPLALQMIRTALKRPWSSSRADRDKMVCRFEFMQGSHLQTLRCETNARHQQVAEDTKFGFLGGLATRSVGCDLYCVLVNKAPPFPVMHYVDQHQISRGALLKLMKKLPPAGSSYTLRITDHGKTVVEYVVKHGEISKIYVAKSKARSGGS